MEPPTFANSLDTPVEASKQALGQEALYLKSLQHAYAMEVKEHFSIVSKLQLIQVKTTMKMPVLIVKASYLILLNY